MRKLSLTTIAAVLALASAAQAEHSTVISYQDLLLHYYV